MSEIFEEDQVIGSLADAKRPVTLEQWFELHEKRVGRKLKSSDFHVFCVMVLCEWAGGFGPWRHVHRERKGDTFVYRLDRSRYQKEVA